MEINPEFLGKVLTEQSTELKKMRESIERIEKIITAVCKRKRANPESTNTESGAQE
ncbi:MAG: hypothetical protein ABSH49_36740 [Bryobacteraceae bacterium]|jgi:hypothetical protein